VTVKTLSMSNRFRFQINALQQNNPDKNVSRFVAKC